MNPLHNINCRCYNENPPKNEYQKLIDNIFCTYEHINIIKKMYE